MREDASGLVSDGPDSTSGEGALARCAVRAGPKRTGARDGVLRVEVHVEEVRKAALLAAMPHTRAAAARRAR